MAGEEVVLELLDDGPDEVKPIGHPPGLRKPQTHQALLQQRRRRRVVTRGRVDLDEQEIQSMMRRLKVVTSSILT